MGKNKKNKKRYIVVADFCHGCKYLKENIKPNGFEYLDLEDREAQEILDKVDLGDEFTIPLGIECDEKSCKVCKIDLNNEGKLTWECD